MEHLLVSINVVLPIFIIILVGYFLRYVKLINETYIKTTMKVVFNVCLPAMMFAKVSKSDIGIIFADGSLKFIVFVFVSVMGAFLMATLIAYLTNIDEGSKATFIQGSFRSNYVILGLKIIDGLFGDQMIGRVAILVIVVVPIYNILTIFIFSKLNSGNKLEDFKQVLIKIAKNPLIISIALGFVVAIIGIEMPSVVNSSIAMLGSLGTPLGLIGIGAYFKLNDLRDFKKSMLAVSLKVIVFPSIVTLAACLAGFGYMDTILVFVLFGSPAAISSFTMATAFGGNSKMAADIVIMSTMSSLITLVLGLSTISYLFG